MFLAPSTKYDREENLKFFALIPEKGYVKPIAYLMNKKEPKPKINRTGSAKLADISTSDTGGGILGIISDTFKYDMRNTPIQF